MTIKEAVQALRSKAAAGHKHFPTIEAKYNAIADLLEAHVAECEAWRRWECSVGVGSEQECWQAVKAAVQRCYELDPSGVDVGELGPALPGLT
jgi:hypothetical protein